MIRKTSDCNGCADGCHGCGLSKPRLAVFCDDCHREIDAIVYTVGDKHICDDCLPSAVPCVDVDTLLESAMGVLMREYLFRGKRCDNGKWVEGDLFHNLIKGKDHERRIGDVYFGDSDEPDGDALWSVIPETVGQYTGLTDKNGRKIFEGDIVRYSYDYPDSPFLKAEGKTNADIVYRTGDVFWSEWRGSWAVSSRVGKRGMNQDIYVYSRNPNRVEVIGNIHDNPELLGGHET